MLHQHRRGGAFSTQNATRPAAPSPRPHRLGQATGPENQRHYQFLVNSFMVAKRFDCIRVGHRDQTARTLLPVRGPPHPTRRTPLKLPPALGLRASWT
jgi:hypothetical protein